MKKQQRKRPHRASTPVKRPRLKSSTITVDSDDDEQPTKKRIRKSHNPSAHEDEESPTRVISETLEAKNSLSGRPMPGAGDEEPIDRESVLCITGSSKYMKMKSWEEIVQTIETAEFDKQLGYIVIYMLLK
jgi:hypothetical protein